MAEFPVTKQKMLPRLDSIGQEFDLQREFNNPFALMRDVFRDYKNGPLVLALGAVGGGGAGAKAQGILEQLVNDKVSFRVAAMKKYLDANPLIKDYLKKNNIETTYIDDSGGTSEIYGETLKALEGMVSDGQISGVLSLGPRTFYPEAARRLSVPAMIIDGAVPDKWENETDEATGLPNTAYFEPAYNYATYATTCGFGGWKPPNGTYPEGMDLRVIQQPFSDEKINRLKELRNMQPSDARDELLARGVIKGLGKESIIIVPTMDQVYLNPQALTSNGGFMSSEQFVQTYAFMAETIASASFLANKSGRKVSVYLRPGIIQRAMEPILKLFGRNISLLTPQNGIVENDNWLLLRKAGVTIGRAPLCVSTAEALGMNDYQITAAVPGETSDGESYMTERKGLDALYRKGLSRIVFPGEPLLAAIEDVVKIKKL